MLLGKYSKRPTERKRYNVDFSTWLDDGKIVVFYVSGGQPGVKYDVELRAITSKGDTEVNTIAYNVTAR